MPIRIPHTYRTPSGTYYLRLLWPKSLRTQFSCLNRDIRLSLRTQNHLAAKQRMHGYLSDFYTLIDLLYKYTYNGEAFENKFSMGLTKCTNQLLKHDSQKELMTMLGLITCENSQGSKIYLDYASDYDREEQTLLKLQRQEILLQHQLKTSQETSLVSETVSDSSPSPHIPTPHTAPQASTHNVTDVSASSDRLNESSEDQVPQSQPDAITESPRVSDSASEVSPTPQIASTDTTSPTGQSTVTAADTVEPSTGERYEMTVQDLIDDYVDEQDEHEQWPNPSTRRKYVAQLRSLAELLGENTPLNSLSTLSIVSVKKQLIKYPNRRYVGKRADISLQELLVRDDTQPISSKTAKGYFELLKKLFKHAVSNGYIEHNIAISVDFKTARNKKSQRGEVGGKQKEGDRPPFEDADLIRLFSGYIYGGQYTGNKRAYLPAHFWVPLIALYSGARVNEVCQLMITDICSELTESQGRIFKIPHFIITDKHPDQVLKTENAARDIPIHGQLIKLGFLDFVAQRKAQSSDPDNERLFEGMVWEDSSRWGRTIGRWFNGESSKPGYITKMLGQDRGKKTFHSFRHTVADMLRNAAGVEKSQCSAILGHEGETVTDDYGDGYWLEKKKEAIDKIQYSAQLEGLLSQVSFADFERFAASIKPRSSRKRRVRKTAKVSA